MNFLNNLFGGLQKGGAQFGGGFGLSNVLQGLGGMFKQGGQNQGLGGLFGGTKPAMASPSISPSLPMQQPNYSQMSQPRNYMPNAMQSPSPAPIAHQAGGGFLSSLFGGGGLNKQQLLGTGLTALGAFMPVANKVPQSTQSLDQLRALQQSGGGPLNQSASAKLQSLLGQQLQPMTAEEENQIHRQYQMERDRRTKTLQDLYHNAQPGVDYTTSSNYTRDNQQLQDDLANQENAAIAQGRRQIANDYNAQQMGAIGAANGIDTSNTQLMSQIAGMDINQLMQQLQVNRDDAYYLKNLAVQMGTSMLAPPNPLEGLLSQFALQGR